MVALPRFAKPTASSSMPTESPADTEASDQPLSGQEGDVAEIPSPQSLPATPLSLKAELKIFGSTFLTIFLAELGDKTQVTTLLMSAESQSPWSVFVGAGAALVLTSLLGVLVGRWLASRLHPKTLDTATGTILLMISVWLLWDVVGA